MLLFCCIIFFCIIRPPPVSTLFPYTTLFRSARLRAPRRARGLSRRRAGVGPGGAAEPGSVELHGDELRRGGRSHPQGGGDRKSTRLNSSHVAISYAVFCLKKKTLQVPEENTC